MKRNHIKQAIVALILTVIVGISGVAIVTRAQGGKLLSVQTKSMVPVLEKGDLVSVKNVPASSLLVGDVITFINPANKKQTITHRIVALPSADTKGKFITRGDANAANDEPIETTQILGKMTYSAPYVGYFADFIRLPIGLALIIYVPALMVIISEMRRLAEYYKTQQGYRLSWYGRGRGKNKERTNPVSIAAKSAPVIVVLILAIAIPAKALLTTSARLVGNTIVATRPVVPPVNACATSGNSTTIVVTGTGSGNVSVNNSNNQNAQSGNASVNNNGTGGSATSGNATNCNNTNININIGG